jgi:platelet-activating factor acetylhydrolase
LELDDTAAKDQNLANDKAILSRTKDSVRGWVNLSADVESRLLDLEGIDRVEGKGLVGTPMERVGSGGTGPAEAMVEGEALGQVVEEGAK